MMEIVNVHDRPRIIAATDDLVEPDNTVTVDDDLGQTLCRQSDIWAPAGPPAESDLKVGWINYAVTQGVDRGEAEDMTKAELIKHLEE